MLAILRAILEALPLILKLIQIVANIKEANEKEKFKQDVDSALDQANASGGDLSAINKLLRDRADKLGVK